MQKNFPGVKKLLPESFIIQKEVTTTKTHTHTRIKALQCLSQCNNAGNQQPI